MDVVGVQVQPPPLLEATVQRHLTPNHPAYVRLVDFRLARVTAQEMATSIFGRIQAGVVYTPDEYVDITFTDGEGFICLFDEQQNQEAERWSEEHACGHVFDQPEIFSYPKHPRFSNSKTARFETVLSQAGTFSCQFSFLGKAGA